MKDQQALSLSKVNHIVIKSHGNLEINSWDRPEIGIRTDIQAQKIRQEGKELVLLFLEDCELTLPLNLKVEVSKCAGKVRIQNIKAAIEIGKIEDDLVVQNVKSIQINRVNGDCYLRNTLGPVKIGKVAGQLKGEQIQSGFECDRVYGDVTMHSLVEGCILRSEGDVQVSFDVPNENPIKIRSSGNISIVLPEELDGVLETRSNAEEVVLDLAVWSGKFNDRKNKFTLGNGKRKIILDAGGSILVSEKKFNKNEIALVFSELDALWVELGKERQAKRELLQNGENDDQSQKEYLEAEKRVQVVLSRLQQHMTELGYGEAIEVETEKEIEKTNVSHEEQLIIMRLLAENKISIEEADTLIDMLRVGK
ncbi:MAG: hypothetical protein JEZ06_14575 [Anaerolineaceae bacterium]|nr:hypothetical protein [Anaerolineaceae bacterium]